MGIMIDRRRVMGKKLPYDAKIEYLETDGNAYIDIGLTLSYYRAIAGKYYVPDGTSMIWGSRWIVNWFQYQLRKASNGNSYIRVNDKTYVFKDTRHIEMNEFLFNIGNAYVVFNGVRTDFPAPSQLPIQESNNKEILFKYWDSGRVADGYDTKRIYYAKYWESSVLIRDFIPVRIGTTGYMYDRVSKQLFGNSGTGKFILGPDVNSGNS